MGRLARSAVIIHVMSTAINPAFYHEEGIQCVPRAHPGEGVSGISGGPLTDVEGLVRPGECPSYSPRTTRVRREAAGIAVIRFRWSVRSHGLAGAAPTS